MTVNELKAALESIAAEHGDKPVMIPRGRRDELTDVRHGLLTVFGELSPGWPPFIELTGKLPASQPRLF